MPKKRKKQTSDDGVIMTRLFVAIDFSPEIKMLLSLMGNGLKNVSWTPRNNFHLTLSFLGEIYQNDYYLVRESLEEVSFHSFNLEFWGVDLFKSGRTPRTLWVGIKQNDCLIELQKDIENKLIEIGIEVQKRNFSPHITLGRFSDRLPRNEEIAQYLESHAWVSLPPIEVDRFHLFSSKLYETGGIYRVEESYRCS